MTWIDWAKAILGIGWDYALAAALVAGGAYLALFMGESPFGKTWLGKPFIIIGIGLIVLGSDLAIGTYFYSEGLSKGDATCRAEWNKAGLEAKIKSLETAALVKEMAANDLAQRTKELEAQNESRQGLIEDYRQRMEKANIACRRPTAYDRRRVCAITGNTASGCSRR